MDIRDLFTKFNLHEGFSIKVKDNHIYVKMKLDQHNYEQLAKTTGCFIYKNCIEYSIICFPFRNTNLVGYDGGMSDGE